MLSDLSPAQQKAAQALRKAWEQDLINKNEARALEGKKPLSARANYLAGTWLGDRIASILDADGNMVGIVTGTTKDIQVAREWLAENKPNFQMSPEATRGKFDRSTVIVDVVEVSPGRV